MYDLPQRALNRQLDCARTNVKAIFKRGSKKRLIASSRIFSLRILATADIH